MRHRQQRNNQILAEKDFQRQVLELAAVYGWLAYHVPDSRRVSCRGVPDVLCIRPFPPYGFFFAELKTEKGKLRPEQKEWLEALQHNGIEYHVWRPSDFDEITARFQA